MRLVESHSTVHIWTNMEGKWKYYKFLSRLFEKNSTTVSRDHQRSRHVTPVTLEQHDKVTRKSRRAKSKSVKTSRMAAERVADNNNTRRRVKLYMLNEERVWDDRGTGHVSSSYVDKLRGMALLVRSENDGTLLLESKILPDTAYQKQQETLIVWSEAENYDLALSFQERAGCDEIWEKICQVQGKDPSVDITQEVVEESEDDRFEEIPDAAPPIDLPPCDLSKLEEISELFSGVLPSLIRREKLSLAIENDNYIKKLLDVFHMCEDLENLEGLHHLYDIFKSMFMLNKNALFEIMFAEDTIFDVIGVLEYDPSLPDPAKHREFLRNKAKFKEVIPLNNSDLVQKIHQTFRVQYIQDVILPTPSVFEENTFSTLNTFIFFNKVEIVGLIQEDEKFLYSLFAQLVDDETDDNKRRDLVFFLKEFCTFSQTLQAQSRETFFKTLSNMGVLGALETILGLDDNQMKSAAVDIFSYIVEFSPSMVREFIVQEGLKQDDEDLLINLVIEQMISDTDPEMGGAVQLMGILRVLIDPDNMQVIANKTEITEFLGFFYKHSMHILTAPLFANTSEDKPSKDDYQTAQLLSLILELLTFCIEHHTYHIKNYVLTKDLLKRVLVLLKSEHAFLALGALRMMRKIIAPKDDFYNRYIIRQELFKPVVDAFLNNGPRYNLLNSAMIEMFEFIKLEDIKSLIAHIVENHWDRLQHITYIPTFSSLKARYEQQQDARSRDRTLDTVPSILRNNRFNRRDGNRTLDDDEELWFDQDDDIADTEDMMPMSDMLKSADMIKSSKIDEFDAFSMKYESKKAAEKENEEKETMPKFINRTSHTISLNINRSPPQGSTPKFLNQAAHAHTISLNVSRSPPGSAQQQQQQQQGNTAASPSTPPCSPNGSPNNSPITPGTRAPYSSPNRSPTAVEVQTKKPGLVGLVDYDNDSDEEDPEDDSPALKRARTVADS